MFDTKKYQAVYYKKNKKKILTARHKRYRDNPTKSIQQSRKWAQSHPLHRKYLNFKSNSRRRGIEVRLSLEDFVTLVTSRCVYGKSTSLGIDRKNSSKDYTMNNSVPCCYRHNLIKGILPYRDMMKVVQVISFAKSCGNKVRLFQRKKV